MRFVLCFLLAALGLAPSAASAGRRPEAIDDALAWATTDRAKAIAVLEAAWESQQSTEGAPLLAVYAGEQHRLAGDEDAAHLWFTRALSGEAAAAAELGLALVTPGGAGPMSPHTVDLLNRPTEKLVPATQNADRFLLLARRAAAENDPVRVAHTSRKALAYAREDAVVFARVSADLALLSTGAAVGPAGTSLEKAEAALGAGQRDEARRLAESARAGATPGSTDAEAASWLLRRIDAAPVVPGRIAVLLPLSGKFEAVGGQVREAFEYGWKQGGGTTGLVFVDSGAEAGKAAAAVEKAALVDGAIAVVGPLLADEAEAAATVANHSHLPMVALSQGLDQPARFPWVVQAAVTPREQIEGLVTWLVATKGIARFGIFAPSDDYGTHAAAVFGEVVKAAGGSIGAVASYDPEANVVTEAAAALALADSPKNNLDYDALFLPDNARRIPLACAGLAFEEFPLGTFAPHPNIRPIPLIGLNGYNSAQLVTAGNEYVRGAMFTDVFLASGATDRPVMAEFSAGFRSALGRTPTSLEAAAADAGRIVASAASGRPTTRDAFRAALLSAHPSGTVTGVTGFDPVDHTLSREMLLLTIGRGGISVLATLPAR